MSNSWKNFNKLIEYPKSGVLSKVLYKTDKIDVTLFCLAKGTEISEHTSTKKGLVLVLEGRGTFILLGEKIKMLPGVMIFMKKNAVHSLKSSDNTTFILILYK